MERLIIDIKIHTDFLLTKQKVRTQHLDTPPQSYVKNCDQVSLSTLNIKDKTVKKLNDHLVGID